ncbi:MAG: DUF448 domain-containing protein [Polyangiales bacterium]
MPERTCAGCRAHDDRDVLLRFVHVPENDPCIIPDFAARLGGRGIWVHPRVDCLRRASRGGFSRALRAQVTVDHDVLRSLGQGQILRRLDGLLLAAKRRRGLALGTDAVRLALAACTAHVLLVAKDAAGRRDELVAAATEQRVTVIELSTKAELGRLTGKETLGLLAVLDVRIAREIAESARSLAGLSEDG